MCVCVCVGVVYNYTRGGVLRDQSGWERCVSVPLVRPDMFHLLAQWDQYLDHFSDGPMWDPAWHRFDEEHQNCFTYCLHFINSVLAAEGRSSLSRESFTHSFILPRMRRVSKYTTLYDQIQRSVLHGGQTRGPTGGQTGVVQHEGSSDPVPAGSDSMQAEFRAPRRRTRVQEEYEAPLPLSRSPEERSDFRAELINQHVLVCHPDHIQKIHNQGYFGKGVLSRARPDHSISDQWEQMEDVRRELEVRSGENGQRCDEGEEEGSAQEGGVSPCTQRPRPGSQVEPEAKRTCRLVMAFFLVYSLGCLSVYLHQELMMCYIIYPVDLLEDELDSPECLSRLKVQEVIVSRWVSSRERVEQDDI
ncbi:hypothetical protein INR49_001794 [Caranx melampygus]|nr:hypothetical protein INR49_001794 [Caranx melampygus]